MISEKRQHRNPTFWLKSTVTVIRKCLDSVWPFKRVTPCIRHSKQSQKSSSPVKWSCESALNLNIILPSCIFTVHVCQVVCTDAKNHAHYSFTFDTPEIISVLLLVGVFRATLEADSVSWRMAVSATGSRPLERRLPSEEYQN